MEYVLLEAQEAAEQRVVIVLDELSCCWRVSRVQTSQDSTTNDSFDAMSIMRLLVLTQCCMWSSSEQRERSLAAGMMT